MNEEHKVPNILYDRNKSTKDSKKKLSELRPNRRKFVTQCI